MDETDGWILRAKRSEFEFDLPPEYCHYRDEGCELAASCLRCPYPCCVHDEVGGERKLLKQLRAREMARLHTEEGKSVKELATMFGVSPRTVQRALKAVRDSRLSVTRQGDREKGCFPVVPSKQPCL